MVVPSGRRSEKHENLHACVGDESGWWFSDEEDTISPLSSELLG